MKIYNLIKILVSIFFLLVIPISCEKENQVIEKKTDNTAETTRLTIIADKYFETCDYKNAHPIYKKIISISDPINDRANFVDALISLAYIYQYQGDYIQSEETITKVLPHLKYFKKTRFAWNVYFIQGFNYFKTENQENALAYFRKALHLKTSAFRKWCALNSIGIVYMKQKKYKAAAYIFEKITTEGYYAQKFKTNTLDRFELIDYSVMLNNLGICYYNIKNSKALDFYNKALKIRLETNDRANISTSYTVLSEYYLKDNPSLAMKYAKMGYKKALEINLFTDQKYCLSFLVQSSNGKELKKYSNMYVNFIDSINTVHLKQKNQFSDIKYNFKKDQEENLELKAQKTEHELEIQRQKNRSFVSSIIITVSILSLVFIVFYVTKKGKRDKANEIFKNEIRISEKLQFELEKDIDKILSFTERSNLEKEENKEQFLTHLNNIYSKTRNISRENSEILTDENFEKVLKEMISGYTTSNLNILINGLNALPWSKIDRVKKITLFRVVQEIFDQTKMLNKSSLVSITFKENEKNIIITYADNTTEIHNDNFHKRFANIENRLKLVKGIFNVSLNPNKGFKVLIQFPI